MKKVLTLALALAMCVSVLTACGQSNKTESSASSEPILGSVLYLRGTISDATDKDFTLTMDDGGTVKVAILSDTEVTAKDGIKDGTSVSVGCLRVDDSNVNATLIKDRENSSLEDGGVLYLVGTVSNYTDETFTLTLEDGTAITVQINSNITIAGTSDKIADGATIAIGCKRIDDKNVDGISVEIK